MNTKACVCVCKELHWMKSSLGPLRPPLSPSSTVAIGLDWESTGRPENGLVLREALIGLVLVVDTTATAVASPRIFVMRMMRWQKPFTGWGHTVPGGSTGTPEKTIWFPAPPISLKERPWKTFGCWGVPS